MEEAAVVGDASDLYFGIAIAKNKWNYIWGCSVFYLQHKHDHWPAGTE
jgi:hypothetical protein